MPTTLTMVNESGHESLSSPSIQLSQPATNHSEIWLSGLFVVRNCSNSKRWSGSLILIKTGHVPAEMQFKRKCEIKVNNCVHQIPHWHKKNASLVSRQSRGINKLPLPSHSGAGACAEVEFDAFSYPRVVAGPSGAGYASPRMTCGLQPVAGKLPTPGHFTWLRILDLSIWVVNQAAMRNGNLGGIFHLILRQLSGPG